MTFGMGALLVIHYTASIENTYIIIKCQYEVYLKFLRS